MTLKQIPLPGQFYDTFSGHDALAFIVLPESQPIFMGELTTFSYSIYREKNQVRTLGRINAKGFTKGPRTVAGTMIFTMISKHVSNKLKEQVSYLKSIGRIKFDEFPPFDIIINFANEYGATAKLVLFGVEITDEGQILSIEDMFTENTMTYKARDVDVMDGPWTYNGEATAATVFRSGAIMDVTAKFGVNDLIANKSTALEKIYRDLNAAKEKAAEAARVAMNSNTTPYTPPSPTTPTTPTVPVNPGANGGPLPDKVACSLTVIVQGNNRQRINGATVVLQTSDHTAINQNVTGGNGEAYFPTVVVGQAEITRGSQFPSHIVTVSYPDYSTEEQPVYFGYNGNLTITVELTRTGEPDYRLATLYRMAPADNGDIHEINAGDAIGPFQCWTANAADEPLKGKWVTFKYTLSDCSQQDAWSSGLQYPSGIMKVNSNDWDHISTIDDGTAYMTFKGNYRLNGQQLNGTEFLPVGAMITVTAIASPQTNEQQSISWYYKIV